MTRPAAGGGRWVEVSPERLAGWLAGFTERHGATTITYADDVVSLIGADGSVAEVHLPFPPLVGDLVEHSLRDRRVGVLLVRLGGYAAGVFEGTTLVSSKVGSRQVHGRSAAGGQSQQRFARRRDGQVRVALDAATENAVQHLLPHAGSLDAVVTGGERTAVETVLADRRLVPLLPLVVDRLIDVPDPRLAVLQSTPALFRAARIRVIDP